MPVSFVSSTVANVMAKAMAKTTIDTADNPTMTFFRLCFSSCEIKDWLTFLTRLVAYVLRNVQTPRSVA